MSKFKDEFEKKKKALSEDIEETKVSISKATQTGVRKTKSFFRKLFYLISGALVVLGILYLVWCNWSFNVGTRTGTLVKISTKGYVFKTLEGELNLGGFSTGENNGFIGNIWDFSIKDENVYQQLENLEGERVTLRYKEINKAMPWQGETNNIVYEVVKKD